MAGQLPSNGPLRSFLARVVSRVGRSKQETMKDFLYNSSRYPQLGLMTHDTYGMDTEFMKEVRSRLPKNLAAEREIRISRALLLDAKQQVLPREEWMTRDKDVPYLLPYIEMVDKEFKEKQYYQKKIYKPFYKIQNLL
ncbi:Cytochrome b-c1 complex subunit 7 [Mactra antiquata]